MARLARAHLRDGIGNSAPLNPWQTASTVFLSSPRAQNPDRPSPKKDDRDIELLEAKPY